MGTVNPGNDPFLGGSITRTGQANVAGSIPSANTFVSNPINGVAPGITFSARNNQGSNIGIPYTRLVPLYFNSGVRGVKSPTDQLRATTVAFILGKRSRTPTAPNTTMPEYDMQVNHAMAPGMPGTERFQKLCSLEYLNTYFESTKVSRQLKLDGQTLDGLPDELFDSGLPAMLRNMATKKLDLKAALDASTLQRMQDLCMTIGYPGSAAAKQTHVLKQGIFFRDHGPFLRGKAGYHTLLAGTPSDFVLHNGATEVQPYHVNRSVGDDLAFALFDQMLEMNGVTDWRPDGIVLSKGADDPSDDVSDAYLKARDGELFNMRVQGPAITSSWAKEPAMEVMPLDKVFVVIVADVWWGDVETDFNAVDTPEKYENYKKEKNTILGRGDKAAFETKAKEAFKEGRENVTIVNFRVRLATSSEMVNHSALKFDSVGVQMHGDGEDHGASRMGLRLGKRCGEYIVGGWCIGSVLDTSASRAAFPNAGNIGVRTAPNSMAINLNVKVEWWNADQMYRTYMNDGSIKPRYVQTETRPTKMADIEKAFDDKGPVNVRVEDFQIGQISVGSAALDANLCAAIGGY
tara:strand:- start:981 stop:2705 length:1725 start_codon:yes stop_codon:yes gene_type:complete